MNRTVDVSTSFVASVARLGLGMRVSALGRRPEKPLELYEFENCPFCRKVREALSLLDLEAFIYPCPKGGTRFRPRAVELGGKQQFPYLVDPNTGQRMYESNAIVRYLFETYGDGKVPIALALGPLTTVGSMLASWSRGFGGALARPSRAPEKPLELWSYESSPYCRLVREALCRLELPYLLHNVAKGSPRRSDFVARSGRMMVPFLSDPNTGTAMFESADIIAYLEKTYGTPR
ncbi:glutathione S-transferase [Archangium minus]|uniref:Glutathione S-transferase n=1 Tax=Archangium minus TaxID=83450 RepID=A0ABY9WNP8_9BACT|nr:glutathione S-transferase [Archangium violaceum]WNG43357.1 glutathione S-transferase [Archangium minus]